MTLDPSQIETWCFDADGEQMDCKPFIECSAIADEHKKHIASAESQAKLGNFAGAWQRLKIYLEYQELQLRGTQKEAKE